MLEGAREDFFDCVKEFFWLTPFVIGVWFCSGPILLLQTFCGGWLLLFFFFFNNCGLCVSVVSRLGSITGGKALFLKKEVMGLWARRDDACFKISFACRIHFIICSCVMSLNISSLTRNQLRVSLQRSKFLLAWHRFSTRGQSIPLSWYVFNLSLTYSAHALVCKFKIILTKFFSNGSF